MTQLPRQSVVPVIPEDVIERAVCIVLDHVVPRLEYPSCAEAGKVRDVTLAALTASGLPARVAELEAAIERHRNAVTAMYHAETPNEPDATLWAVLSTEEHAR